MESLSIPSPEACESSPTLRCIGPVAQRSACRLRYDVNLRFQSGELGAVMRMAYMREPNDWRLTNQLAYLKGVVLEWRSCRAFREGWEHDHCEFCWVKFAEGDDADVLHDGYATADELRWVCANCFADFQDLFAWVVVAEPTPGPC